MLASQSQYSILNVAYSILNDGDTENKTDDGYDEGNEDNDNRNGDQNNDDDTNQQTPDRIIAIAMLRSSFLLNDIARKTPSKLKVRYKKYHWLPQTGPGHGSGLDWSKSRFWSRSSCMMDKILPRLILAKAQTGHSTLCTQYLTPNAQHSILNTQYSIRRPLWGYSGVWCQLFLVLTPLYSPTGESFFQV